MEKIRPIRIGIEAQRLFRQKKGGMDVVVLEMIRNLQKIDKENEYYVFVKPDADSACFSETENFHLIEVEGGNYMTWEQWALPKAVKATHVDVLHCTSNTAPLFCPVPLILTLHDIIFLEQLPVKEKGTRYQQLGKIYRKLLVPRIVNRCQKILTVSHQEKKRILDYFGLPEELVQVVYNGVGEAFFPVKDPSVREEVRKAYDLPERYFLFLGNQDPKKNMPGVLEAFGQYAASDPQAALVLTAIERPVIQELLEQLGRPELIDQITLPGYVAFAHLPALYSMATAYLYPSLREGFGLPILEGFACGVPVITSDTSSMPEVAGEAALLVDPTRPEAISDALQRLMQDPALQDQLIRRGLERVKAFSWERTAREALSVYLHATHSLQKTKSFSG